MTKRRPRRKTIRLSIDGLTLTVTALSIVTLNVLLFAGGALAGIANSQPQITTPVMVAQAAPLPIAQPAPKPVFRMPRWTPPAEVLGPPTPSPEMIASLALRNASQSELTALIHETAKRYSIPPYLMQAVVRVESNFNPRVVSHKGARGLMQIMPATARRYGFTPDQMFEPEHNLNAGATFLRSLLKRYDGDLDLALAAYNAGERAVERYGGVPPYRETRTYIKRVRAALGT